MSQAQTSAPGSFSDLDPCPVPRRTPATVSPKARHQMCGCCSHSTPVLTGTCPTRCRYQRVPVRGRHPSRPPPHAGPGLRSVRACAGGGSPTGTTHDQCRPHFDGPIIVDLSGPAAAASVRDVESQPLVRRRGGRVVEAIPLKAHVTSPIERVFDVAANAPGLRRGRVIASY